MVTKVQTQAEVQAVAAHSHDHRAMPVCPFPPSLSSTIRCQICDTFDGTDLASVRLSTPSPPSPVSDPFGGPEPDDPFQEPTLPVVNVTDVESPTAAGEQRDLPFRDHPEREGDGDRTPQEMLSQQQVLMDGECDGDGDGDASPQPVPSLIPFYTTSSRYSPSPVCNPRSITLLPQSSHRCLNRATPTTRLDHPLDLHLRFRSTSCLSSHHCLTWFTTHHSPLGSLCLPTSLFNLPSRLFPRSKTHAHSHVLRPMPNPTLSATDPQKRLSVALYLTR